MDVQFCLRRTLYKRLHQTVQFYHVYFYFCAIVVALWNGLYVLCCQFACIMWGCITALHAVPTIGERLDAVCDIGS